MALRPEWTPGNISGKQMMSREGIDKIIGYLHDHGGVSLLTTTVRRCWLPNYNSAAFLVSVLLWRLICLHHFTWIHY